MSTVKSMHTNLVYALSILFLILGILGYLDIKNFTYLGYQTDGNYKITQVEEGSPAESAGIQVGDDLVAVDSLDVRDTKAWTDVPRATVGETRNFTINRGGEEINTPVTYVAQNSKDSMLNRIGWTIGLIFLLMALWAFRAKSTWAAFLFAMFSLGFAGSFMGGPHIENGFLDDIVGTIRFSFVLAGFAFLVDFLLNFPKKSSFAEKANAGKIIYGPAILLILFFLVLTILKVDSSSGLNIFIRYAMLLFVAIYFGWALLILVRNYAKASTEEKSAGLTLMFWGAVIGLVPILIGFIVGSLMPTVDLPGSDYYFLTMALIPICFALAIRKS